MASETERIKAHSGAEYQIPYHTQYECDDCGEVFSDHTQQIPSSCRCGCTNIDPMKKIHEEYLKYQLFSGEEENARQLAAVLRHRADQFEAMQENGWELQTVKSDSHVTFVKQVD